MPGDQILGDPAVLLFVDDLRGQAASIRQNRETDQ